MWKWRTAKIIQKPTCFINLISNLKSPNKYKKMIRITAVPKKDSFLKSSISKLDMQTLPYLIHDYAYVAVRIFVIGLFMYITLSHVSPNKWRLLFQEIHRTETLTRVNKECSEKYLVIDVFLLREYLLLRNNVKNGNIVKIRILISE